MKPFKLGKKEYTQIETMFDINDYRFMIFKQYILQTIENIDKPVFLQTYSKYMAYLNAGEHAQGFLEWNNFKKSIELKELNHDAMGICFALLCLEKDEDQQECSKEIQIKKLDEMRANGLSRGQVEETVVNFMKASPKTFGVYLAVLEMTIPQLKEEFLKE